GGAGGAIQVRVKSKRYGSDDGLLWATWSPRLAPLFGNAYDTRKRQGVQSMDLQTKLQDDMKVAMKAGQKERLGVIRMLLSDVKNVDLASKPTTAEQAVEAYAKKLRKSVEEYERLGKPDEVAKLKAEMAIVDEYLPKKAS